jgi:hypothetical protein
VKPPTCCYVVIYHRQLPQASVAERPLALPPQAKGARHARTQFFRSLTATEVNARLTPGRIEMDATVVRTERVIAEAREFLDRVSGRSARRLHGMHKTLVIRQWPLCASKVDRKVRRRRFSAQAIPG